MTWNSGIWSWNLQGIIWWKTFHHCQSVLPNKHRSCKLKYCGCGDFFYVLIWIFWDYRLPVSFHTKSIFNWEKSDTLFKAVDFVMFCFLINCTHYDSFDLFISLFDLSMFRLSVYFNIELIGIISFLTRNFKLAMLFKKICFS